MALSSGGAGQGGKRAGRLEIEVAANMEQYDRDMKKVAQIAKDTGKQQVAAEKEVKKAADLSVEQRIVGMRRSLDQSDKTTRGMADGAQKVERSWFSAGKAIAAVGIAIAAGALLQLGRVLFRVGVEAEQAGDRYQSVFGPAVERVNVFLAENARKMALTTSEAQKLVAGTGALTRSMGATQEQAADMAVEVHKVAADLAAFHGLPTETALNAIQGALSGSTRGMRELNIRMEENEVQARALHMTGKQRVGQLTQLEKAQAALAIILEKSADATGALDASQGKAGITVARVAARFRQLREDLAVGLMPVFDTLLQTVEDNESALDSLSRTLQRIAVDFKARADTFARAVSLDAGEAWRNAGLYIGAKLGEGILRGLEGTIRGLNLFSQIPGPIGEAFDQINLFAFGLGKGADIAKDSAEKAADGLRELARATDEHTAARERAKKAAVAGVDVTSRKELERFIELRRKAVMALEEQRAALERPITGGAIDDTAEKQISGIEHKIERLNIAIEGAQDALAELASTSVGGGGVPTLDELRQRELAQAEAERAAKELQKAQDEARKSLDDLLASYRTLRDLGIDQFSEEDAALRELGEQYHELGEEIRALAADMALLGEGDTDLLLDGAQKIEELREQQQALLDQMPLLRQFGPLVEQVGAELIALGAALPRDQLEAFTDGMLDVQTGLVELGEAQNEYRIAVNQTGKDSDRSKAALKAVEAAQKKLTQALRAAIKAMEDAGVSAAALVTVLDTLEGVSGAVEVEDGSIWGWIKDNAGEIEGVARGLLSVGDALGVIDDRSRRALQGVVDLAAGLARLSTDPIGGIAQGIGGIVGVVSGLFGGDSAADRARREALARNTEALRRLTQVQERAIIASASSAQLQRARDLFAPIDESKLPDHFLRLLTRTAAEQVAEFRRLMDEAGMSVEDVNAMLEELGLQTRIVAEDGKITAASLYQVSEELRRLELSDLFAGWAGAIDKLRTEFALFDIDDPIAQLKRWREELANVDELTLVVPDFDIDTSAGRDLLDQWIRDTFRDIEAGTFDTSQLGEMSVGAFVEWLARIESLLDEADVFGGFRGELDRLRREFDLFDINDPIDQLQRYLETIQGSSDLLQGSFDLDTAEGRAQLEKAIQELFMGFEDLAPSALGDIGRGELLDLLGMLENLLDRADEGGAGGPDSRSFQEFRGITEITASRLEGLLTTDVYWNETTAKNVQRLVELAGGSPVGAPGSFPAPNYDPARFPMPGDEFPRRGEFIDQSFTFSGDLHVEVHEAQDMNADQLATKVVAEADRKLGEGLRRAIRDSGAVTSTKVRR